MVGVGPTSILFWARTIVTVTWNIFRDKLTFAYANRGIDWKDGSVVVPVVDGHLYHDRVVLAWVPIIPGPEGQPVEVLQLPVQITVRGDDSCHFVDGECIVGVAADDVITDVTIGTMINVSGWHLYIQNKYIKY